MIQRLRKAYRAQLLPLVLAFVVLLAVVGGRSLLAERQSEENAAVRAAFSLEERLASVLSRLQDAETGQRGYLLTGDPAYLEPYHAAVSGLQEDMRALTGAGVDDPTQAARIEVLGGAVDAKLDEVAAVLTIYRERGAGAAAEAVKSNRGKLLMDNLREIVGDMRRDDRLELRARLARSETLEDWMRVGSVVALLAAFLVGIVGFVSARRWLDEIGAAQTQLTLRNTALEREIETREAAEAQVRQMQKMEAVGQLTGGIAHDFNNMLSVIISATNLIQRKLKRGETDIERFVEAAADAAGRAATLTSRLLAFSRQQPLSPQVVDANRLLSGMSDLLRRSLGETVAVETVLAGGLWRLRADASQLENAVLNLAVNGRDAMPEGGRLTIETANAHLDEAYAARHQEVQAGQYVMLAVTDTGLGMEPDVAARAFDPFFTTKPVNKGTGLGLSQVHGFVKQSGGHVKIYSEPGHGTTIKIYLPRHLGPEEVVEAAKPVDPGYKPTELVLVVEDDERVRAGTVAAVRELGYAVIHAGSADEAMARLAEHPDVHLLFTDVMMPGTNGKVLAEKARAAHPDLKVLFTTGFTRNAVVHNGVLDAGVDFIAKPFTLDQLAAKLRDVLGR